jgi:hypothetical protein
MANLIAPGVSVTITDESFFIPAAAVTVPLIFIATADEKTRPDGVTAAAGTYESNVVRTVTSLRQSTELYGVPRFMEDSNGQQQHGDARNEYGLFALNQFLGVGDLAYVVRANVNLNDNIDDLRDMWDNAFVEAGFVLENAANEYLNQFNQTNGYVPSDPDYKTTLDQATFISLATQSVSSIWDKFSFRTLEDDFIDDHTSSPFLIYANGYNVPSTGSFLGLTGISLDWVSNGDGSVVPDEWTPEEAGNTIIGAADQLKYTLQFFYQTSLGANDAARRVSIVTALQAAINSNTDVRSEQYEFNLVLCPGYHECADELVNLIVDIEEEAFAIGDVPMNMDPDQIVTWAGTTGRAVNRNIAYYYPHGLASNLDGKNVFIASSGIALRVYTYSDEVSELWFAPAGTRRGIVTGVADVGYITGNLGSATTFVPVALSKGQKSNMYKYFTNLNPIEFIPNRGIIVMGQKTSSPDASALDRVNVARLIAYVKRQLRKNALPFVFQPNDQLTRDSLKAAADGFLGDLIVKRGLYDFVSQCDEGNNTPDRIDRNEMYLDVALKPVKAAEFIYIPIRVVGTGTEI